MSVAARADFLITFTWHFQLEPFYQARRGSI
jgi:hypothetical protein